MPIATFDTPVKSFRDALKQAMARKKLLTIPGAYDALSALLCERAGFACYFIGGFPVVGSRYGVPDIGLGGFGEISSAVRDIVSACRLPAFVDADDGYGDAKNAVFTLHTYERMGVSGLCFEDQAWPKRCGHMAGKNVVPVEQMEAKLRAVCAERRDPETFIMARCDARAPNGFDDALRRAERYVECGVDGIFVEAPQSVRELEILARSFVGIPQFANPIVGGKTPLLTPDELEQMGFNGICFGLDTLFHATKAMQAALDDMKSGRFALRQGGTGFDEFKSIVGYDEWARIDERYGAAAAAPAVPVQA